MVVAGSELRGTALGHCPPVSTWRSTTTRIRQMIDSIRIGLDAAGVRPAAAAAIWCARATRRASRRRTSAGAWTRSRRRPDRIVVATHAGRRGHPMIFPASLAEAVRSAECDGGLTGWRRNRPQLCVRCLRFARHDRQRQHAGGLRAIEVAEPPGGVRIPITTDAADRQHQAAGQRPRRRGVDRRRRPLALEILREDLALTGTKYGCGEGGVRRVLGARRRQAHLQLQHAGLAASRASRSRRSRASRNGRRAAPRAAGVSATQRLPVRLLHAGHDHGHGRVARRASPTRPTTRSATA